MKKTIVLLFILSFSVFNLFSQEKKTQFSFWGGYEYFPELRAGNG